jgi:hypothetical protein
MLFVHSGQSKKKTCTLSTTPSLSYGSCTPRFTARAQRSSSGGEAQDTVAVVAVQQHASYSEYQRRFNCRSDYLCVTNVFWREYELTKTKK